MCQCGGGGGGPGRPGGILLLLNEASGKVWCFRELIVTTNDCCFFRINCFAGGGDHSYQCECEKKSETGELWPGTAAAAVQMATNGHCRRAALAC